ncbi:hypothetical protein HMPREF9069_00199 [Atopobium sp. oral taxon 810 str. F0209]|nr:hypothetical protein HMPREF9069_00199 [Atopobium sp. oral taxon 810 str. F0209]
MAAQSYKSHAFALQCDSSCVMYELMTADILYVARGTTHAY